MASYRYVLYDVMKDLRQIYDDSEVSEMSVVYWLQIYGDYYRRIRVSKYNSHRYLTTLSVTPSAVSGHSEVSLPPFYDYERDKGLASAYVVGPTSYNDISIVSMEAFRSLLMRPEQSPSATNRIGYVEGSKLMVFPQLDSGHTLRLSLYLEFVPSATISLDDEYPVPMDLIPIIKADILKMGRLALSMPDDPVNDSSGRPTSQAPLNESTANLNKPTDAEQ